MGEIYLPKETKRKGPWLLGVEELEVLDLVFENVCEKLTTSYSKEIAIIEKEGEKSKSYIETLKEAKPYKVCYFISNDEIRLVDKSIKGLLKDPKLKGFKPKEMGLSFKIGNNNSFVLELSENGDLQYNLDSFDTEIKEELNYEIEKWIRKNKPWKVYELWKSTATLLFLISLVTFFFSLENLYKTPEEIYKNDLKKQAHTLVANGITQDNEKQAEELILKIESDYTPSNLSSQLVFNNKARTIIYYSLIAMAISIFCPTNVLGFGKYESKLHFYKFWLKFVTIIFPAAFVYPAIINLVKIVLKI